MGSIAEPHPRGYSAAAAALPRKEVDPPCARCRGRTTRTAGVGRACCGTHRPAAQTLGCGRAGRCCSRRCRDGRCGVDAPHAVARFHTRRLAADPPGHVHRRRHRSDPTRGIGRWESGRVGSGDRWADGRVPDERSQTRDPDRPRRRGKPDSLHRGVRDDAVRPRLVARRRPGLLDDMAVRRTGLERSPFRRRTASGTRPEPAEVAQRYLRASVARRPLARRGRP